MLKPVPSSLNFSAVESDVQTFWEQEGIPARTLKSREGAKEFVFYEGPPTANAKPGTHHIVPRAFKDIYTRFQTMKGHYVPRKGGWDCHGLPVEIEVEKKLGLTAKQQIVEYGVEKFNALCRESVVEYVGLWERFSERMGYWLDYTNAYWTMAPEYMESVWWSLKQLHSKGMLYEDDKITPYCPRCETPLSDHELGQPDVYRDVDDPSVFVGMPLIDGPHAGAELAVWTTTPWTLPSNLAVAVGSDVTYGIVSSGGRRFIVATDLAEAVFGEGTRTEATFAGSELVGSRYTPPFSYALASHPEFEDAAWRVLAAEFVTTTDGTGIVHLAPAFGADDKVACRDAGISTFNPVDEHGRFTSAVADFSGQFVKDADPAIIENLRERGILIRSGTYTHSYPHCWRCKSPLLYYAMTSWYIRTSEVKDRLLEVNDSVNWVPDHIREGRFGKWLENNVDWSLSRNRFWATPLPIWRCENGHATAVESRAELGKLAGADLSELDPHRPFVDEVTFPCPECSRTASRVADVIDVWYDSGAMPFAQWGYPHRDSEMFRKRFPADFIAEAVDQTRGWFYTLMAEGVLLFDDTAYRNVVCHGHVVDTEGRKMSKSLGNTLDPWELFDSYGADILRFFFYTAGQPGDSRRLGNDALDQVARRPFGTLWNVYRLFVTYATIDGFDPDRWNAPAPAFRPDLDRWILAELHGLISEVNDSLESYDAVTAGRRITEFVEDLSNWYVRRSRRRFWRSATTDEEQNEKASAYFTLWTCLVDVAKLLAPMCPHLAEAMYRNLVVGYNPNATPSVHLCDFPQPNPKLIDPQIVVQMAVVRELASLGHAARSDAGVKVRQPLARAVMLVPEEFASDVLDSVEVLADELNVRRIEIVSDVGELVTVELKPDFRAAGPKFGQLVKELAAALAQITDPAGVAERLEDGETVDVTLSGGDTLGVTAEDVEIRRSPAAGTAFAFEAPYGVSLDLDLPDDLVAEGRLREAVHLLQVARKDLGLEVTDRILLTLDGDPELVAVLTDGSEYVADQLLATEITFGSADTQVEVDGLAMRYSIRKA